MLCFVLLLMYAFFCALTQGSFFGIERILSTLNYAYFLGFLSLGVTFVIATGGIDFSIGPVMFCCALISGYCFTSHGMPMPVALILSIVIGLIFGIFNGYLVAYWSVPSFITSMASMNISKGVASVFTKTQSVSWPQEMQDGGWFRKIISIDGIPVGLIIFLAVAIVCAILLNKTKLGRYILCLGSNKEAVRLSGVNVKNGKCLHILSVESWLVFQQSSTQPLTQLFSLDMVISTTMSNCRLCNGWYIHGRRTCFYQWYSNRCIHHRIASGRYSCSWLYKRLSAYHHRSYRYRRSIQ